MLVQLECPKALGPDLAQSINFVPMYHCRAGFLLAVHLLNAQALSVKKNAGECSWDCEFFKMLLYNYSIILIVKQITLLENLKTTHAIKVLQKRVK